MTNPRRLTSLWATSVLFLFLLENQQFFYQQKMYGRKNTKFWYPKILNLSVFLSVCMHFPCFTTKISWNNSLRNTDNESYCSGNHFGNELQINNQYNQIFCWSETAVKTKWNIIYLIIYYTETETQKCYIFLSVFYSIILKA